MHGVKYVCIQQGLPKFAREVMRSQMV
jgi:hypothetical protein